LYEEAINEVLVVLDESGFTCWVTEGTPLGLFRFGRVGAADSADPL